MTADPRPRSDAEISLPAEAAQVFSGWPVQEPADELVAMTRFLERVDSARAGVVRELRARGSSWQQIGELCGMSGEGARRRWSS